MGEVVVIDPDPATGLDRCRCPCQRQRHAGASRLNSEPVEQMRRLHTRVQRSPVCVVQHPVPGGGCGRERPGHVLVLGQQPRGHVKPSGTIGGVYGFDIGYRNACQGIDCLMCRRNDGRDRA
jgi:hypothetical protein